MSFKLGHSHWEYVFKATIDAAKEIAAKYGHNPNMGSDYVFLAAIKLEQAIRQHVESEAVASELQKLLPSLQDLNQHLDSTKILKIDAVAP